MALPRLKSIQEKSKTDWRAAFAALKYIPQFFNEIRKSGPLMFYSNVACRLFNALTPIATLWVGKLIIDEIVLQINQPTASYENLWPLIALEFGIVIIADIINRLINLTDGLLGDLYANASSIKIIEKTNQLSIAQLEDSEFYDKLERARTQTNGRVGLMSNTLLQFQDVIVIISLISGLIYFEPWLIILLLFSIIPSFINELNFTSSRYSIARSWTAERRTLDYLRYIGANAKTIKEIKLFSLTGFIAGRFKNLSNSYYNVNKNLAVRRSIWGAVFNILGILSYYAAYILIVSRVLVKVLSIGDLTFLAGSFNSLRNRLQGSFSRITRISESALNLQDYFDFLNLDGEKKRSDYAAIPQTIQQGFTFKNVSFAYPGADQLVLKNINFTLRAGEKMAFVGENGAGKTTLIKLILRFYQPASGEILLDGINIEQFEKAAYQKMFGVIFQDFIKYEFTIKENIAVGSIGDLNNLDKINQAAENSLANEVINSLKDGYHQQLGKRFARGTDLSGGQWQKIALARAYMKDASVMILDEPTSALDARAEYEAFQRFIGLTKNKTSIIISHRFSTVRMANRILVLKDGTILEIGNHKKLMENKQLYAELFSLQAVGYR